MTNIAVRGFGRIGRSLVKAALRDRLWSPAVVADIKDPTTLAALFEFDSNYGRWPAPVSGGDGFLRIGDHQAAYLQGGDIPDWGSLGVDLVVDCTSFATRREGAEEHLRRGASRVLVSAPSKSLADCDAVVLPGINLDTFDPGAHRIVSMASCTTNALAPVVKVLKESLGIRRGFFATVHAYTNTQSLTDQPMAERRDSWAATENIIPSPSGAAKALGFIWPDLKITGKGYRVPVRTGSIVELDAEVATPTDAEQVKDHFRAAAETAGLKGILAVLEDEFASARVLGETHSSIVDLPLTQVLDGTLVSVAAWYDNEMGYATRLAEMAALLSQSG